MDDAAVEWLLAQSGDDPNMGARPLRRAIQKHVEDPVSELLIAARDEKLEAIEVRVGPEGLTVIAREPEPIVHLVRPDRLRVSCGTSEARSAFGTAAA